MARSALVELERLLRLDDGDEHAAGLLREKSEELGAVLGLSPQQVASIEGANDVDVPHLRARVRAARQRPRLERQGRDKTTADQAAVRIATDAVWTGDHFELPAGLVLGDLLADRTCRTVSFEVEGEYELHFPQVRLIEVSRALVVFGRVRCTLTAQRLGFHWREERGQLRLFSQPVREVDRSAVRVVALRRRSPGCSAATVAPARMLRAHRWIDSVACAFDVVVA